MKKIHKNEIGQSEIIDPSIKERNIKLTWVYKKFAILFMAISAKKGRIDKKRDDVQEFFIRKLCKMPLYKITHIFIDEALGHSYIRRMYINHLIDMIREEGRSGAGMSFAMIDELSRDERAIGDIHAFIEEEEIAKYRRMIAKKFKEAKYITIFDLIIQGYKNKEIAHETNISSIGTIRYRIINYLKTQINRG